MYFDRPSQEHLERTGLSHQTNHSCSEGPEIVCDDLPYSEIKVEEEACQTLVVVVRRNSTKQLRVQRLLVRVLKSGVGDQREELDFLINIHCFPPDSESVFGVPEECRLCCVKALGKLIVLSMLL
jgi:hypothetical protein